MTQRRRRRSDPGLLLRTGLALATVAGVMAVMSTVASAASTHVTPDRQLYATSGADPYMDQDLHLSLYGGQPQAWSLLHLNLTTLPAGSTIEDIQLALAPNGNAQQNAQSGTTFPVFNACILTQPIPANYDPSNPPAYDCSKAHSQAQQLPDGSWTVDLTPLAIYWASNGNDGLALVGAPQSGDLPPNQYNVTADAWELAFDHTKTSAKVDYVAGPVPASSFSAVGPLPPLVVQGPPAVAQPTPTAPAANPAPPPTPRPRAPTQEIPSSAASSEQGLSLPWLYAVGGFLAAAIGLLVVGAVQQRAFVNGFSLPSIVGVLASARSKMATPVAVMSLAAAVSIGFAGQAIATHSGPTGTAGGGVGSAAAGGGSGTGTGAGSAGGTGGGGGAGGAAGGGGGASGAGAAGVAGAAGSGASAVPGVTATTVTIGSSYLTDTNNNNATFGVQGDINNYGPQQQELQAVVDWVNQHGGVAGRRLQIYWQQVSQAHAVSDPNYLQEDCQNYTEDNHVFAVVDFLNSADAQTCYAQHRTFIFDLAGNHGGEDYFRQLSPFDWSPVDMATDRQMKTKIQGLDQLGFFSNGTVTSPVHVGVLVPNEPREASIYNNVTVPELERLGISASNIEDATLREDSTQDYASDIQSAVVTFNAHGVNHVLVQGSASGGAGGTALIFMEGAYKQQWYPYYGLGSNDAPEALEQQNSSVQQELKNAVAVGWAPGADTETANGDAWPPRSGPEARCLAIEKSENITFAHRADALLAFSFCDAVLLMWQATEGATTLTDASFGAAIASLGNAYQAASAYASSLSSGQWDAPNGYRLLYADPNCSYTDDSGSQANHICFKYKSFTTYQAPALSSGEP